jgi:hypothetical protein
MAVFQGLFLMVLGVGLIIIDCRSLSRGWLPCGPSGLRGRLEFQKEEQPIAFWGMFVLYLIAGIALTILAAGIISGIIAPLPFRRNSLT